VNDESPAALASESPHLPRARRRQEPVRDGKPGPQVAAAVRVFLAQEQLLLDRAKWRDHLYPLNQIVGLHLAALLVNKQPLDSAADAEAYLKRVEGVGAPFDQLMARMEAQAKQGIYMPKSV
jgi:uncharacterized protein (DUF885 family)